MVSGSDRTDPTDGQSRRDHRWITLLWRTITLASIILYLYRTERPLGTSDTVRWLSVALWFGLETRLYLGFALLLVMDLKGWWHTVRRTGLPSAADLRDLWWLSTKMERRPWTGRGLAGIVLILLLSAALGFAFSHRVTALGAAIVGGTVLHFLLEALRSPDVLYLSTSRREQIALQSLIKRMTLRTRVVSLLDLDAGLTPDRRDDEWIRSIIGNDCLRTDDHSVWREAVQRLSRLAPVIVIDARAATTGLLFEAGHLLSRRLEHKTVFVVDDELRSPLLAGLIQQSDVSEATVIVSTERTVPALIRLLMQPGTSQPTPSLDIVDTVESHAVIHALARRLPLFSAASLDSTPLDLPRTPGSTPAAASPAGQVPSNATLDVASALAPRQPGQRKCSGCGHWREVGSWVCAACGQMAYLEILSMLGVGAGCLLIGLTLAGWWWRWGWLLLGLLTVWIAGNEILTAVRVRRHLGRSSSRIGTS